MTTTPVSGSQTSDQTAQGKTKEVAGEAADQGRHLADTAREEAATVANEARDQVRSLLSEATSQLDEQSRAQQERLAGTVRTMSDDLSDMTTDRSGLASDLVRQGAERARGLADHLEQHEPRDLLDGVQSFARRRPGAFLLGALVAGVVAGRMTRAAQGAPQSQGGQQPQDGAGRTGTQADLPVPAGTVEGAGPVAPVPTGQGRGFDAAGAS